MTDQNMVKIQAVQGVVVFRICPHPPGGGTDRREHDRCAARRFVAVAGVSGLVLEKGLLMLSSEYWARSSWR